MKAGIITFHGAHNYGAILQAYALQEFITANVCKCDMINYRKDSQIDFNSLYPHRNGIKSLVKNILMLRYHKERKLREQNFENFLKKKLNITELYTKSDDLASIGEKYDYYIAGSDQIWNTSKECDMSLAYFLDFVSDNKVKIAYAASIGSSSIENIEPYKKYIEKFQAISCREKRGSEVIEKVVGKNIPVVLDPTLLVDNKVFIDLLKEIEIKEKDYILYYSLDGFDKRKHNVDILKKLSIETNKKVVVITPEWPKKEKEFINIINAGPIEFLAYIYNASIVCTNSFHGTALSIALNKNFFVLERYDGKDDRKHTILNILDLKDRVIEDRKSVTNLEINIDYDKVNKTLAQYKELSSEFLLKAMIK